MDELLDLEVALLGLLSNSKFILPEKYISMDF
jgi:hypothetical protein